MPEFSFPATERLKSKKQIQHIFAKGKSLKRFPLRLLYLTDPIDPSTQPLKMAVAVSGKKISKAVDRNKVKRWVRESYRTQNTELKSALHSADKRLQLVFIFLPGEVTDFESVRNAVFDLLEELKDKLL